LDFEKENEMLRAEVLRQREVIEQLEHRLDQLLRLFRSSKSEKFDSNQLLLLEDEDSKKTEAPSEETSDPEGANAKNAGSKKSKKPRGGSRIKGLERLEIVEEIHDPLEVQLDPEEFELIDEVTTDRLELIPRKFFIKRHRRRKYRRKTERDKAPVIALAPPSNLKGALPAASLLSHLLVGKYCDHTPLYRQEQMFQRSGLLIPKDLLLKWLHGSIGALMPVALAIRDETLDSEYLQVDETKIRYLEPGHVSGKAPFGYLWLANDPSGSLFYHWGIGRGEEQLIETIGGDFHGFLQVDGWSAYLAYEGNNEEVTFMSCLAHIRRRFFEHYEASKKDLNKREAVKHSWQILGLMRQLYHIERQLRETKAGPRLRQAIRSSQSRPIVKRLGEIFGLLNKRYRPSHPLSQALSYAIGQWDRFQSYLENGLLEIDNNLVENAVRPTKLGMKNWLFFGSKEAGHHGAAIYTIIENCRRFELPIEDYLREVLEILPTLSDPETQAADLTPARIAAARRGDPRRHAPKASSQEAEEAA